MSISDVLNVLFIFLLVWPLVRSALKAANHSMASKQSVLVIPLEGVIRFDSSERGLVERIRQSLERAARDGFKAVVLQINSTGGTVGATHEIYMAVLRARKQYGIKVVAMLEDVAASGGIYVAMAADAVVATPGTITGSIGVIMRGYDLSGVLRTIGIATNVIKGGAHKDLMSSSRPMTDEERALLQSTIDDTHAEFRDIVGRARKLAPEQVNAFADGRILSGNQALKVGLVDGVGSLQSALHRATVLAGLPAAHARAFRYEEHVPFGRRLRAAFVPGAALEQRVESLLPEADLVGIPLLMLPR